MGKITLDNLALCLLALSGIVYLWFAGTRFMGVHTPPVIAALGIYVALTVLSLKRKLMLPHNVKRILQVSLLLVGWMSVRELLAGTDLGLIFEVIGGRIFIGIIAAFCMYFLVSKLKSLKFLTYMWIAALAVSAIVGIGQYFVGEPFIRLWKLTGGYLPKLNDIQHGHIAGLALYSIPLGYQLCMSTSLVFGLLVSRSIKYKKCGIIILLILLLALFLTQSRSAVVGSLVGVNVVMLSFSKQQKWILSIPILLLGGTMYLLYGMYVSPHMISFEYSAQTRLPLFTAAILTGLSHPLGVGRKEYLEVASGFFETVSELPAAAAVKIYTPHNQFLNILGYYGFPGLILQIAFYIFLFRLFSVPRIDRISHPFLRGLQVGLLGGFSAYLINSLFHNAGPFIGDPVNWYFIGLALVTNNLISVKSEGRR